jgi:XTP/dITP diphosphohydrolase
MEKIQKILIGTHNKGKFREISYLLSKKLKKFSPGQFKIKSPKETGKSFKDNSLLKAKYFYKKSKMPSISDDSGLEVVALYNRPGIYSARWAKKYGSFKNAMKKILNLLEKKKNRNAFFVCSLAIKLNDKKTLFVTGKIKGKISYKLKGSNGFGYDPIFIPQRKKITFGQMSKKSKIKIDHRFVAFKKLKKKLKFL